MDFRVTFFSMERSPFGNTKLNDLERVFWLKLSVKERLERALSWGREIEMIHQKIYGKKMKLQRLKQDIKRWSSSKK